MPKRYEKGFTLLELMIVIAVIGVLGIVLIPKIGSLKSQSKEAGLDTNIRVIRAYVESKIERWVYRQTSVADIAADLANAFAPADSQLTNPITMKTLAPPPVGADLTNALYSNPSVYIAGTFDGQDIGAPANKGYLKGTIVVAVQGVTNNASARIHSIHLYAHNENGDLIDEKTVVISTDAGGTGPTGHVAVTGVSVQPNSISLVVGQSQPLFATVEPDYASNKNVTWSSHDPTIATVTSAGIVTGVSPGITPITVTTLDGSYYDTCTVTVTAAAIPVTGISLDRPNLSISVGQNWSLSATISPSNATNQSVTWSSSNPSAATVSAGGVVTGISPGTSIITISSADGPSASCNVTVTAATPGTVAVSGVTLNEGNIFLNLRQSLTLIATVTPDNATNKNVTWSSSDPAIASVSSNGVVTAGSAHGNVTITVRTVSGGFTATCNVHVRQ